MTEHVSRNKKAEPPETNPFKRAWSWWKKIARKIGDFNARVILTIFYLIPFLPFAVAVKTLTDPLEIKKKSPKGWHVKEVREGVTPLESAQKQF